MVSATTSAATVAGALVGDDSVTRSSSGPVGILVAVTTEFDPLRKLMTDVVIENHAGLDFHVGKIKEKDVVLCLCGIGRTNAAAATAILCAIFKPKCVINSGSAGALGSNLKIGDVVIANSLVYGDVDNRCFNYKFGQVPGAPAEYSCSRDLLDRFQDIFKEHFQQLGVYCGQIVTTESFVADDAKKNEILKYFPEALAVEMEGCAVAHACKNANTPSLVVRSISDTAADHVDYAEFAPLAGERSAQVTGSLVEHI